jgi:uncharacterized membrane-anchored protein
LGCQSSGDNVGETGGDALSMSMHLGYALSSAIFLSIFVVMVAVQLAADTYRPFLYWSVIVATTTAGTTMADFADPIVAYRLRWWLARFVGQSPGRSRVVAALSWFCFGRSYHLA